MTQTIKRTSEEIKKDAKALLKACLAVKTKNIKDKDGRIWRFGPWYGETPHFRTAFGHWSEMILGIDNYDSFSPYEPVAEQDLGEWEKFYKETMKKD